MFYIFACSTESFIDTGFYFCTHLVHHEIFTRLIGFVNLDNPVGHFQALIAVVDAFCGTKSSRQAGSLAPFDSVPSHGVHIIWAVVIHA